MTAASPDVPALIAERNAAFQRHFRARDAERLVDAYFVPDALQPQIYPAGSQPPVGGRATLVARFAAHFDTLAAIEPQTHAIDHVDGMAVEIGRARLVPLDAARPVQLARYCVVWVPTPAGWRAKTDFFAADGWPDHAV